MVVSGSHGGIAASLIAARAGAAAVLLNDAGVGKDQAGIAGLAPLGVLGVAAAVVGHESARIGDGGDTAANGVITHVNSLATAAGVEPGQAAAQAIEALEAWTPGVREEDVAVPSVRPPREVPGEPPTIVCDSMSQAGESHAGSVVVSGSHGGDMGGRHAPAGIAAAFFNDAGVGKEEAGIARLPLLDEMGIPAAAASNRSARIGDGEDTLARGVVSHVNRLAAEAGLEPGTPVAAAVGVLGRSRT